MNEYPDIERMQYTGSFTKTGGVLRGSGIEKYMLAETSVFWTVTVESGR